MNFPGASNNWNGRAVTATHTRPPNHHAEKIEYFCGPIDRALGQKERAEKLVKTLAFYAGWQVILAGHSNGAAVVLYALKLAGWPRVESIHLLSGACESDFTRNGLNAALLDGKVGRVRVYVAGKDRALRLAHSWAGRLLGYGTLGLHGPEYVDGAVKERVTTVLQPDFGHSEWFTDENFKDTMKALLT